MLWMLTTVTLLLSAADHWTTYLCLRSPVPGWEVREANPLAAWLFERVGLAEGLLLDSALTIMALAFLLTTRRLHPHLKLAFLATVIAGTGYAVANNLRALEFLGLSPFGV